MEQKIQNLKNKFFQTAEEEFGETMDAMLLVSILSSMISQISETLVVNQQEYEPPMILSNEYFKTEGPKAEILVSEEELMAPVWPQDEENAIPELTKNQYIKFDLSEMEALEVQADVLDDLI